MAGWLKRVDGSFLLDTSIPLDSDSTSSKGFSEGGEDNNTTDGTKHDRIKGIFNEFLGGLYKEFYGASCIRPLPPLLGDGSSIDLYDLYIKVRKRGGYETVSRNGEWGLVAEDCGFVSKVRSGLKLVYAKYLDILDTWLKKVGNSGDKEVVKNISGSYCGSDCSSGVLPMDLEPDLKGLLSGFKSKKDGEFINVEFRKCELNRTDESFFARVEKSDGVEFGSFDDGNNIDRHVEKGTEDFDDDKGGNTVLDEVVAKEDYSRRKRKRESYSDMLNWVLMIARDPCDPRLKSIPERSKWKCYGSDHIWKQVLLAREAMRLKRNDSSVQQSIWQKKQMMHPTMYDDHNGSEKLRCSKRLLSAKDSSKKATAKVHFESSSSCTMSDEDRVEKQSTADSLDAFWIHLPRKKRVPVGRPFQADLPEWKPEIYESDPKWLGTRIWPLQKGEQNKYLIEREPMGKGRQDSCGCQFPGSSECVKFHISEKRGKAKLELGSAFYLWKFNSMGEEVSIFWTKDEEKKFEDVVKSNPLSKDKCFWDELSKCFPKKSRESLISYYYNVFLLQRRGYQNRSTPSDINSDDDESEFVSDDKPPGSIFCSPKKVHLN